MKPTILLSCLFALALTSVVSAEEPGRPPERREGGDRDKPRERGPETEVRKAEPTGAAVTGEPKRGEGKKPEGRHDEGQPKGPRVQGGEKHEGKGDGRPQPHGGPHGKKAPHGGPGHPGGPHGKPEMHKGPGGEMPKGRGEALHDRPGGPERMKGQHEGPGHPGGPPVNHVMEAIKHLHAAGMHEVASLLEAKVKRPGHPAMGMGFKHPMKKPPFAQAGGRGHGHGHGPEGREGWEMQRGPRPEGEKKLEGRPEGGPQRG